MSSLPINVRSMGVRSRWIRRRASTAMPGWRSTVDHSFPRAFPYRRLSPDQRRRIEHQLWQSLRRPSRLYQAMWFSPLFGRLSFAFKIHSTLLILTIESGSVLKTPITRVTAVPVSWKFAKQKQKKKTLENQLVLEFGPSFVSEARLEQISRPTVHSPHIVARLALSHCCDHTECLERSADNS